MGSTPTGGTFRRPPTAALIDYIDAHRDRFGVEPICRVRRQGSSQAWRVADGHYLELAAPEGGTESSAVGIDAGLTQLAAPLIVDPR